MRFVIYARRDENPRGKTMLASFRAIKIAGLFAGILLLAGCAQEAGPTAAERGADISAAELNDRISSNTAPLIIDVRSPEEFAAGHLPNALNIAHTEFVDSPDDSLALLPADRNTEIVIHCVTGRRAGIAADIIVAAGFTNVRPLTGHYQGWQAANYEIVTD
jgi:rhodanese-related sulfurtransferase